MHLRNISLALAFLSFFLMEASLSAVTFPATGPSGSYSGGSFGTYFKNIMENPCPVGQVITSFKTGSLTYGQPNCIIVSGAEVDPEVGANTANYLSKWNGSALVASAVYESGGSLGLGTANPQSGFMLDVSGQSVLRNNIYVAGNLIEFSTTNYKLASTGNNWLNSISGNLGIGTIAPFAKLSVVGDIGQYSTGNTSVGSPVGSSLYLGDSNFNNSGYYNSAPGLSAVFDSTMNVAASLGFYTYAGSSNARSERMRILSNGNVGIGTISPGTKLEVAGQVKITGGTPGVNKVLTSDAVGLATWNTIPMPCIATGTGTNNTCYGVNSLQLNTGGGDNTAIGSVSLVSNTIGYGNTAIGKNSLYSNTTGSNNTANGGASLYSNSTGFGNVGIGLQSLYSNTTGSNNTANGGGSLYSNTIGFQNTAIGAYSLYSNTTGLDNMAAGNGALYSNTTGYYNTAVGYASLYSNGAGNYNTAQGFNAGQNLTTGDNNTALGANTNFANTTGSNQLNIANIIFGTSLTGTVSAPVGNVGIGTASPSTKLDVVDGTSELKFSSTGQDQLHLSGVNASIQIEAVGSVYPAIFFKHSGDFKAQWGMNGNDSEFASAGDILFSPGLGSLASSQKMRITGAGNVGIGTPTPTAKVEVVGQSGQETNKLKVVGSAVVAANGGQATPVAEFVQKGGYNLPIIRLSREGYTTPIDLSISHSDSDLLQIAKAGKAGLSLYSTDNNDTGFYFGGAASRGAFIAKSDYNQYIVPNDTYGNGNLIIQSAPNGSGNVGIGTQNPGAKLEVAGSAIVGGDLNVQGKLIVDKLVNRTVTNISISGSLLPDAAAPATYRDIGSSSQVWNNLYLGGQIKIAGGSPGVGKVLVSDAAGLGTWTTPTGGTATGIIGGIQNYVSKFGTGGNGLYASQIFDTGTGVGVATSNPTGTLSVSGTMVANTYYLNTGGSTLTGSFDTQYSWTWWGGNISNTNTGNVGIGTVTPGAKLEVNGQVKITGGTPGAGKVLMSDAAGLATWVTPAGVTGGQTNYVARFLSATTLGTGALFDNGTYVGIGTPSPIAPLSIAQNTPLSSAATSTAPLLSLYNSNGNGNYLKVLQLRTSTGATWATATTRILQTTDLTDQGYIDFNPAGGTFGLALGSQNTEYMRILNGGNVGIGTISPSVKLEVVGNVASSNYLVSAVAGNGICFWNDCTNWKVSMGNAAEYIYGPVTDYSIKNTMNNTAGRGWTWGTPGAAPVAAINTAGTMQIAGNMTAAAFFYLSDKSLKKNIVPLSNSLEKILSLSGYSFDWKSDGRKDIGVIAQEVEKQFPDLVHTDKNTGIKSVEYGNLVAPMIEAMKEQQKLIDVQNEKIQSLESRLEKIEASLAHTK